jgi:hypothetical protein
MKTKMSGNLEAKGDKGKMEFMLEADGIITRTPVKRD